MNNSVDPLMTVAVNLELAAHQIEKYGRHWHRNPAAAAIQTGKALLDPARALGNTLLNAADYLAIEPTTYVARQLLEATQKTAAKPAYTGASAATLHAALFDASGKVHPKVQQRLATAVAHVTNQANYLHEKHMQVRVSPRHLAEHLAWLVLVKPVKIAVLEGALHWISPGLATLLGGKLGDHILALFPHGTAPLFGTVVGKLLHEPLLQTFEDSNVERAWEEGQSYLAATQRVLTDLSNLEQAAKLMKKLGSSGKVGDRKQYQRINALIDGALAPTPFITQQAAIAAARANKRFVPSVQELQQARRPAALSDAASSKAFTLEERRLRDDARTARVTAEAKVGVPGTAHEDAEDPAYLMDTHARWSNKMKLYAARMRSFKIRAGRLEKKRAKLAERRDALVTELHRRATVKTPGTTFVKKSDAALHKELAILVLRERHAAGERDAMQSAAAERAKKMQLVASVRNLRTLPAEAPRQADLLRDAEAALQEHRDETKLRRAHSRFRAEQAKRAKRQAKLGNDGSPFLQHVARPAKIPALFRTVKWIGWYTALPFVWPVRAAVNQVQRRRMASPKTTAAAQAAGPAV